MKSSGFKLGKRSLDNLINVHPDLVAVVKLALDVSKVDFAVTSGFRTHAAQEELVRLGKSKTLNSRHLTGHAVDLAAYVNGTISWDWYYYDMIAEAMKAAAESLNISIEWGGDWTTFRDGPHFQLPWKDYPVTKDATAGEQA